MNIDFSKIDVEAIGKKVRADLKKSDNKKIREKILSVLPTWGDGKPSMTLLQVQKELWLYPKDDVRKQLSYLKSTKKVRGRFGYYKKVIPNYSKPIA